MASKRPQPSASSEAFEKAEDRGREEARDSYGPLAVERHVKDDGRALILYSHEEIEQA